MKIITLQAENIKRLKAVEITAPDAPIVEITGKNGAGKTSVLDAIWWALAGATHIQSAPIRNGENEAKIRLDLGEIKVTRKFKKKDDGQVTTSIVVESAEGARFPSPQAVLDNLLGSLTFDPLEFTRMSPRDQVTTLWDLMPGIPFDEVERQNQADYDERTAVNRDLKKAKAVAEATVVPADAPTEPVDETALLLSLQQAADKNTEITAEAARRTAKSAAIERMQQRLQELEEQITRLEAEGQALAAQCDAAYADIDSLPPLSKPVDLSVLRGQLEGAQARNRAFGVRKLRQERDDEVKKLASTSEQLTKRIEERNANLASQVASAKLPVPGLAFADGGITLNGIPFEQASSAEQLRTSVAIAMTNNPKLRVIRVREGSLLDAAGMEVLAKAARENDFQVWIEVVESARPNAIKIEDGQVVS